MKPRLNRRHFLKLAGAGAGCLAVTPSAFSQTKKSSSGVLSYDFVNNTNGKFTDDQCFWSLDAGRSWHSFATQPSVLCPNGNGRVYFRLGAAPRNLDDFEACWDFIEYAYGRGVWNGNTTQVDAFCIPLTIELGEKKLGISESRRKLFEAFRAEAPKEFKPCVKGDYRILSPWRAGFNKDGPNANYFHNYVEEVWEMYAKAKKTPSGNWTGEVLEGALTFTPLHGGKAVSCPRKPDTQEILLGTGVLARNPQFCAALNRHVLADPADWKSPTLFYQAEPCNWYSKFLHQHALAHKCYGFCYDDVSEQAAYFSGQGEKLTVALSWD